MPRTKQESEEEKEQKRKRNAEAARRYRERQRRKLELKQLTWEALIRDQKKLCQQYLKSKSIQKLLTLIENPQKREHWQQQLNGESSSDDEFILSNTKV